MSSRYSYYGLILILATVASSTTGFAYLVPILSPTQNTNPGVVIHIPFGVHNAPSYWQWGNENLSSPTFPFLVNRTVIIGKNNTIQWINDDNTPHTVTALVVPTGASFFDSGFIYPGKTFTTTLAVSGTYKYACVWHNWLAGVITVKQA